MFRILSLFLALLASCGSPPKQTDCKQLRITLPSYPATFDPRKSGDFVSATVISLLYEGLTRCLPGGGFEMACAERVEISADQKLYTFYLRDTFWSDGTPVTAYDFEIAWKEQIRPDSLSVCAYLFYPISGAKEASLGSASIDQVGIVSLDSRTLQVTLEYPTPYFLSLTSFPSFLPIPTKGTPNGTIVNGPFVLIHTTPHAELLLEKNPSFWNRDKILLDQVAVAIVGDEMTALQMFERGEIDWLGGALSPIPPDALETLGKGDHLIDYPIAASTFCTFNVNELPFSNRHIRKAFSLAIDRETIVSKVLYNKQIAAQGTIPPALWESPLPAPTLSSPDLARRELEMGLEEIGKTKEELGPILLHYRLNSSDRLVAQALQKGWEEVLGLNIKLVQTDNKRHKATLHNRKYQIALTYWIAQYDDPMNLLERFKTKKNVKNYPGWESRSFSDLIDQAIQSSNFTERMELLEKAEAELLEEMPISPIYHWSNPVLCNPRLKNVDTTPSGGVLFDKCYISEKLNF